VGWEVKFWRGENEASAGGVFECGKDLNKDSNERWNESERENERMSWAGGGGEWGKKERRGGEWKRKAKGCGKG